MKLSIHLLLGVLLAGFVQAQQPAPVSDDIPDEIVRKVDPSVVAIQHEAAGGSGFIISPDGYILSNGHVVRGSDTEDPTQPAKSITVILNDERKYPAKVIGFSMDPDISLLKIEPDRPLQPVEFADSRHVQIGQRCFAVGMPLGLKRTFTRGILSNIERTDLGTETKVFQTDAAINSGNSGGPLFDASGRVLGLNTYASRGANNLGFTIPIHVALLLKEHFLEHGRFVRADLPTFDLSELYLELARALNVDRGILVNAVLPGSSAYKSGLRDGDVIIETDGKAVTARTRAELLDYQWELVTRKPGSEITFKVLRGTPAARQPVVIKASLEKADLIPKIGHHVGEIIEHRYDAIGLGIRELVNITRLLEKQPDVLGVLVSTAKETEAVGKAGLKEDDIITYVGGQPTPDVSSFQRELEKQLTARTKAIEITYVRGKATYLTAIAPYYSLRNIRVSMIVPSRDQEYVDLLRRELVASGASVTVSAPKPELKVADFDALLLTGGDGAREFAANADLQRLIKDAEAAKKCIGAIGASAVTVAKALPEMKGKKITTTKADSAELLKLKANYTGKAVETDGKLVTSTGFDRAAVRDFLKALYRTARD